MIPRDLGHVAALAGLVQARIRAAAFFALWGFPRAVFLPEVSE